MLLTIATFSPLLGALVILFMPGGWKTALKTVGLASAVVAFAATSIVGLGYLNDDEPTLVEVFSKRKEVLLGGLGPGERTRCEAVLQQVRGLEKKSIDEAWWLARTRDISPATVTVLEQLVEVEYALRARQAEHLKYIEYTPWIRPFRIYYFMGVDGLSLPLVWLTALLGILCLVYSWNIRDGTKGYYILFLILETGLIGVFCALDFFLFYVFWEIVLLPMYFLIGIWGGPRRIYAAIKFFIYTLAGSVLMLLAMLAMYFWTYPHTFNVVSLMTAVPLLGAGPVFQGWVFVALYIAFAIKVPVFPFHTWLPDAHVEAPTAVSVVLAGILLKMGGYGFFRFSYPMAPDAATAKGFITFIAIIGLVNMIYGALCAMAQKDFKSLVAYSSISHMGYVLLGLAAMTEKGVVGAALQMFTHGVSSAMLFLIVGVVYERAHHRDLSRFGGIGLQMPYYTGIATVGFFTSLGLPGLAGFVSEVLTFIGAYDGKGLIAGGAAEGGIGSRWIVYAAVVTIIITAAYILWTIQRVYLGKLRDEYKRFPDLNLREVVALAPLAVLCVVVGVYPDSILRYMVDSLGTMVEMVRSAAGLPL